MHTTVPMRGRRAWSAAAAAAVVLAAAAVPAAHAQLVNVALNKPVIGGSGAWQQANYLDGTFSADNVTDNANDVDGDPNGGPVNEPLQDDSFWLGKEGDVTEDFVVDLGSPLALGRFELVNTHNNGGNDRATGAFQIFGSNDVAARAAGETGAGGVDLVNPVLLASGSLAFQAGPNDPIEPESFASTSGTPYRYIRFNTLGPPAGIGNVGLNEIRAFEVPEPAGFALLAFGASALGLRRACRRRA